MAFPAEGRYAMQRTVVAGLVLMVTGVAGYAAGVVTSYPGRAFALSAVMLGLVLAGVGGLFSRRPSP